MGVNDHAMPVLSEQVSVKRNLRAAYETIEEDAVFARTNEGLIFYSEAQVHIDKALLLVGRAEYAEELAARERVQLREIGQERLPL